MTSYRHFIAVHILHKKNNVRWNIQFSRCSVIDCLPYCMSLSSMLMFMLMFMLILMLMVICLYSWRSDKNVLHPSLLCVYERACMCVRARACVLARARGDGVEVEERRGFTYSLLVQTSPMNSQWEVYWASAIKINSDEFQHITLTTFYRYIITTRRHIFNWFTCSRWDGPIFPFPLNG